MTATCWVVRDDKDQPFGDDLYPDPHYDTEADAANTIRNERENERTPDLSLPSLHAVELGFVCVTADDCSRCGAELEDYDGYTGVHFEHRDDVERVAEDQNWSTDGIRWQCDRCPPISRDTGEDPDGLRAKFAGVPTEALFPLHT